eukprot:CAMPEP_0172521780 /NCGR_PEP_ID=MMETSP1066-20121228/292772_1 /TAXON_ID=671091 /ORGANISM="Coscinodiscus wailesii, Strain CCMP2513" /LENGTH=233 /DNA_ID=CAMNT_0013304737 /DNA_START=207 /DNA_END=908 /DNA_ORIENTATION=+
MKTLYQKDTKPNSCVKSRNEKMVRAVPDARATLQDLDAKIVEKYKRSYKIESMIEESSKHSIVLESITEEERNQSKTSDHSVKEEANSPKEFGPRKFEGNRSIAGSKSREGRDIKENKSKHIAKYESESNKISEQSDEIDFQTHGSIISQANTVYLMRNVDVDPSDFVLIHHVSELETTAATCKSRETQDVPDVNHLQDNVSFITYINKIMERDLLLFSRSITISESTQDVTK